MKKWYEEVMFFILFGFFICVCKLVFKVEGGLKFDEDNEIEEWMLNMEFLWFNLGIVCNMFEKMVEERNICKEGFLEMFYDIIEGFLLEMLIGDENKVFVEIYLYF